MKILLAATALLALSGAANAVSAYDCKHRTTGTGTFNGTTAAPNLGQPR